MQRAQGLDRRLDVVLIPSRDAARCHDRVMIRRRLGQRPAHRLRAIGQYAQIAIGDAELLQQGAESPAVGIIDLAGSQFLAEFRQLIARGEQGDLQRSRHGQALAAQRGCEPNILGAEPPSGRKRGLPVADPGLGQIKGRDDIGQEDAARRLGQRNLVGFRHRSGAA